MPFPQIPIADVRAYWDRRPCNSRHSPKPAGTKEYFDEVEARKYFVEPHIPAFAGFETWRGKKVLEIGCGLGTDTVNFARAGADVTAVDLSPVSLETAKARVRLFGLEGRVKFYPANAEELSRVVPVEPHDLIYAFGVLHHTPNPGAALAELQRYAKPGTELRLMVYHRWSWKCLWILAREGFRFREAECLIARHSEAQTGCPVTYTYSRTQLRELLRAHGFKTTEMFVDHIFCWRIPDYVQYRYVKEWYWRPLPKPLFRALERIFGWHLCAVAVV